MQGKLAPDVREVKRTLWAEEGKIRLMIEYSDGTRAVARRASELVEIDLGESGQIECWSETFDDPKTRRDGCVRTSALPTKDDGGVIRG